MADYRLGFKQYDGGWRFEEYASVNNLFNRHYVGAVVVNGGHGRLFEPLPDRNFTAGVNVGYVFP